VEHGYRSLLQGGGVGLILLGTVLLLGTQPIAASSVQWTLAFTAGSADPSSGPGLSPGSDATFPNLEPGDVATRTVELVNPLPTAQRVTLTTTQSGALFAGPTPAAVSAPSLVQTLPPHASVPVTVAVRLPRRIGNAYQEQQGQVMLQVQAWPAPPAAIPSIPSSSVGSTPPGPPSHNPQPSSTAASSSFSVGGPSSSSSIPSAAGATTVELPHTGRPWWPELVGGVSVAAGLAILRGVRSARP